MKFSFFIFFIFIVNNSFAWDFDISSNCSYAWEIQTCMEANKNWNRRSIENPICINSKNIVEIAGQIILDKEFKTQDKKIENYISMLEENKDYYFWKNSSENFLKAIDDIEAKFSLTWEYWKAYLDLCNPSKPNSILTQTINCFSGEIANKEAKKYFLEDTSCVALAMTKLEIYKQVTYDILKLNKNQVKKDEIKKYTQSQRTKYDKLLDIIMINIWYMERLWKKWPSKTKNPLK